MNEEFERLLINSFFFASVRTKHNETRRQKLNSAIFHVFSNSRFAERWRLYKKKFLHLYGVGCRGDF